MEKHISTEDFFISENKVPNITEEDYKKVIFFINSAKAFERSTYQCIYIIDYFRKGFMYVSHNISHICGAKAEEVLKMGYDFYLKYVTENDLKMLLEINYTGFKLFDSFPNDKKTDYKISYDFHIKNNEKEQRLIHHTITPLAITGEGRVWLAMCTISLASNTKSGNVMMKKFGADNFYEYNFGLKQWIEKEEVKLTDNERKILYLSTQGYAMKQIGHLLERSVDTIKSCKKNIFRKMKVKSISEAVAYAQNHQLIL